MIDSAKLRPSPSASERPPNDPLGSIGSPQPPRIVSAAVVTAGQGPTGEGSRVTAFVLVFNKPLDRARAADVANYSVTLAMPEVSNSDCCLVMLSAAVYHDDERLVVLTLAGKTVFPDGGQIVVNSAPPGGITDVAGTFLDGSGDGVPGSPAVLTILPGAGGIRLPKP